MISGKNPIAGYDDKCSEIIGATTGYKSACVCRVPVPTRERGTRHTRTHAHNTDGNVNRTNSAAVFYVHAQQRVGLFGS